MRFIDFFAGVGGFHAALSRAGMDCAGAVEIDGFARRVYAARFGTPAWFPEDVNHVKAEEIPEADLWTCGSPCVGFSVAGKRGGLEDPRSGLLRVWVDLVAARRPRFVLFENVYGIFSANGGRDWGEFLARLDEIGYSGSWRVCDARWFGVPQRRRRVFLLAEAGGDYAVPAATLFETGLPFSPSLFRAGYDWRGGQGGLFGGGVAGGTIDWGSGGSWSSGRCQTAPWPEAPEVSVPSSLSGILERQAVPARFFLSSRAAAGILRRAARRGRDLPASLRASLERVANDPMHQGVEGEDDDLQDDGSEISSPMDGQETVGALTSTYGAGAELHPDRMGRGSNQLVIGFSSKDIAVRLVESAVGALTAPSHDGGGWRAGPDEAAAGHLVEDRAPGEPFVVHAAESCAKERHAYPAEAARSLDTTGGFATQQGGTVVLDEPTAYAVRGGSKRGSDDAKQAELAPALMSRNPKQQGNSAGMLVMEPEIYQQHGTNVGPMGTLRAGNGNESGGVPFVEDPMLVEGDSAASTPNLPHLRAGCGRAGETYIVPPPQVAREFVQTMTSKWAKGSSGPAGDEHHNLVADTLRAADGSGRKSGPRGNNGDNLVEEPITFDLAQITHPENRTRPEPGQPTPALAATNRIHVAGDVAATVRAADGHHGRSSPRGDGSDNLVPANSTERSHHGVRRLTATECERLMGLRDGHTCLCGCAPYSTTACSCPDGPRYRVCGNSVAVPVIEWLGRRLVVAASSECARAIAIP